MFPNATVKLFESWFDNRPAKQAQPDVTREALHNLQPADITRLSAQTGYNMGRLVDIVARPRSRNFHYYSMWVGPAAGPLVYYFQVVYWTVNEAGEDVMYDEAESGIVAEPAAIGDKMARTIRNMEAELDNPLT